MSKEKKAQIARENGALGGAPRQKESMRSLVREALLELLIGGSFGSVAAVAMTFTKDEEDYSLDSLKVQVSQVRNELLNKAKIVRPAKGRGMLTKGQIAEIERQLGFKRVQKRLTELRKAA